MKIRTKLFTSFASALFTIAGCSPKTNNNVHVSHYPRSQEVVATYYGKGDGFKNKRTASGEIFNPDELTAAHRSLPFGTMVKVHNPQNGKEVTVRINDRGPFRKNVDIDLSYAAARQLDIVDAGTEKLIITTLS